MTKKEKLIMGRLLCLEPNFGAATIKKLKTSLAIAKISWEIFWEEPHNLAPLLGLSAEKVAAVAAAREQLSLDEWQADLEKRRIQICMVEDENYPPLLKFIADWPPVFFYQGDLQCLQRPTLAVVGTRKITNYGRQVLKKLLAPPLNKLTIVSGMMTGVDEAAHWQALKIGAPTAAILGYGLNLTWPKSLQNLREQILQNGGVLISEYAPDAAAKQFRFPMRNRLVAGASLATLVVEAAAKSGSLITANLALDYGREVMTVPGSIFNEFANGTLGLLKMGAQPVASSEEIRQAILENQVSYLPETFYDDLRQMSDNLQGEEIKEKHFAEPQQNKIYQVLREKKLNLNELQIETELEVSDLIMQLSLLELAGEIKKNEVEQWELGEK